MLCAHFQEDALWCECNWIYSPKKRKINWIYNAWTIYMAWWNGERVRERRTMEIVDGKCDFLACWMCAASGDECMWLYYFVVDVNHGVRLTQSRWLNNGHFNGSENDKGDIMQIENDHIAATLYISHWAKIKTNRLFALRVLFVDDYCTDLDTVYFMCYEPCFGSSFNFQFDRFSKWDCRFSRRWTTTGVFFSFTSTFLSFSLSLSSNRTYISRESASVGKNMAGSKEHVCTHMYIYTCTYIYVWYCVYGASIVYIYYIHSVFFGVNGYAIQLLTNTLTQVSTHTMPYALKTIHSDGDFFLLFSICCYYEFRIIPLIFYYDIYNTVWHSFLSIVMQEFSVKNCFLHLLWNWKKKLRILIAKKNVNGNKWWCMW